MDDQEPISCGLIITAAERIDLGA